MSKPEDKLSMKVNEINIAHPLEVTAESVRKAFRSLEKHKPKRGIIIRKGRQSIPLFDIQIKKASLNMKLDNLLQRSLLSNREKVKIGKLISSENMENLTLAEKILDCRTKKIIDYHEAVDISR